MSQNSEGLEARVAVIQTQALNMLAFAHAAPA